MSKNISIVIPTFQRSFILQQTLNSLLSIEGSGETVEIIVVDDGSKDDTAKMVKTLQLENSNLTYVYQKNSGAAAARNLGAKTAKHDLLIFIDDDILVEADSLRKISDFHQKHPFAILSGRWKYSPQVLQNLSKTPFGRFKIENDYVCMGGIDKKQISKNLYETKSLASFCLSMSKTVFNSIGGFNESFPYAGCEDQEFSAKAVECGVNLFYAQDIVTFHNELDRGEKAKWLERQFTGVQGFPLLCQLYPERKSAALYKENVSINQTDNLSLKLKKIVKKIFYNSLGFKTVNIFTNTLEKVGVNDQILSKLYNLMAGIMIYRGFQIGFSNLDTYEHKDDNRLKENSLQV